MSNFETKNVNELEIKLEKSIPPETEIKLKKENIITFCVNHTVHGVILTLGKDRKI